MIHIEGYAENQDEHNKGGNADQTSFSHAHTTGGTPGSAVTRSRKRAPRISKLRYWSNEAQAGDSNTTASASCEASASREACSTATSSVCEISCGTLPSVAANSCAASPIR